MLFLKKEGLINKSIYDPVPLYTALILTVLLIKNFYSKKKEYPPGRKPWWINLTHEIIGGYKLLYDEHTQEEFLTPSGTE